MLTSSTSSKKGSSLLDDSNYKLRQTDYFRTESQPVLEVYENERYDLKNKIWSAKNLQLPSDPMRYQWATGQSESFPELPIPHGYESAGQWEVDVEEKKENGENGWIYNINFQELDLNHYIEKSGRTLVRRRRWIQRIDRRRYPQSPSQQQPLEQQQLLQHEGSGSGSGSGSGEFQLNTSPSVKLGNITTSRSETNLTNNWTSPPSSKLNDQMNDNNSSGHGSMEEDFTMEYGEEGERFDDCSSQYGDELPPSSSSFSSANSSTKGPISSTSNAAASLPSSPPPLAGAPSNAKKRGSFFSMFSGSSNNSNTSSSSTTRAGIAESSADINTATRGRSGSAAPTPAGSGSGSGSTYQSDPALRVHGTTLSALGKQIKFLENESKRAEEIRRKQWKDHEKPRLEGIIASLEKKVIALKAQLEKDAFLGGDHVAKLDEELRKVNEKLDIHKRAYYFPFSNITLGQGGVYLALTDFWLEQASGSFYIECSSDRGLPLIHVKLNGTQENVDAGVITRLKVEGFKLAGDKGSGVPKLGFDNLTITVAFSVTLRLSYDVIQKKWLLPKPDLILKIISFKGPFGLNRSIISIIVSLLMPTIRNQLLSVIPFELGLLVRTLPCPTTIKGQFHFNGIDLNMLNTEWHKNEILTKMCKYSPMQMEMFYWMQKALDRSTPIKTVLEMITYIRTHSQHTSLWQQIVYLWSQAATLYCEKVQLAKQDGQHASSMKTTTTTTSTATPPLPSSSSSSAAAAATTPSASIEFETFITVCQELLTKRISAHFKLQHVECQLSMNHLLSFIFQIIDRIIDESISKSANLQRIRLMSLQERIREQYQLSLQILRMISKNLDFAQLELNTSIHSGNDGYVEMTIKDILAQAPLLLQFNFSKEKNIGSLPLVPYIVSVKPQVDGDIVVEIYHFTHDSAEVPTLPQSNSEEMDSSHHGSSTVQDHETLSMKSGSENGRSINYTVQNIRSGYYSTSYNKMMNTVANTKANSPTEKMQSGFVLRHTHIWQDNNNNNNKKKKDDGISSMGSLDHLLVRQDEQRQELEHILNDHPIGRQADTVLSVTASSPHISFVVDKATTLKPGAELFTLLLGPQKQGWTPFGSPNMFAEDESAEAERMKSNSTMNNNSNNNNDFTPGYLNGQPVYNHHPTTENKVKPGCPIMVQTSPGIKLLIQVPKVCVNIALPSLIRFFLAHFVDLTLLKAYLESLMGGEFFEEQLTIIKMIVEKIAKYLLLPGLDIDINLNGKIVTSNGEITIRVDTPKDFHEEESLPPGSAPGSNNTKKMSNEPIYSCAIELKAQISLKEIFEDSKEIEAYLSKNAPNGNEDEETNGAAKTNGNNPNNVNPTTTSSTA